MSKKLTLIDAHVHVYETFDVQLLLSSAFANFDCHASEQSHGRIEWRGVLLLAESSGCNWFDTASNAAHAEATKGWRIQPCGAEPDCLAAFGPHDERLLLAAGRQVITREGIEVLTLLTARRIADGMALEETIEQGLAAEAVVVLPWAAGKWLGKRGDRVTRALEVYGNRIFSGDNSGRPWFWRRPQIFASQEQRGRPVLPGTDPLPLAGQERRVGSFGFAVELGLSVDTPATDLRRYLQSPQRHVRAFGESERLGPFVANQVRLRIK